MTDTNGNKSTSACGGVGYVPNPPRLWSRAGGNNCLDAAYGKIALDRKAETLEYKKNGARLSQAQQYSMAARNALTRKKSWATQTQTYTNPNVDNLPEIKIPINNVLSTVSLQCNSHVPSGIALNTVTTHIPTPTPTPTAALIPTPTPTAALIPTPSPTAALIPTPTPTAALIPTPTPFRQMEPRLQLEVRTTLIRQE